MKRWCACFYLVLMISLIASGDAAAEQKDPRWTLAGFTKYQDGLFVDTERRSSPSPGSVAAWIRVAPREKSGYLAEIRGYLVSAGKDPRAFRAIEILCEYNCAAGHIRFPRYVYLNRAWKLYHEAVADSPEWKTVEPGSIWDKVRRHVCP